MRVAIIASTMAWALAIALLTTGCAGSHGWQFTIGAQPITAVENKQALDPRVVEARAEASRKNY